MGWCVVKRSLGLLSMVIIFFLVLNIDATSSCQSSIPEAFTSQSISLQAVSWKAFSFDCSTGDTISGFFKIIMDGDLFPGDQTKYDNWLLGGIDFIILDEQNFDAWNQGLDAAMQYECDNVVELSWRFDVPSSGKWYLIFINNSIYIKQIDVSIEHAGTNSGSSQAFLIMIAAALIIIGLWRAAMNK